MGSIVLPAFPSTTLLYVPDVPWFSMALQASASDQTAAAMGLIPQFYLSGVTID